MRDVPVARRRAAARGRGRPRHDPLHRVRRRATTRSCPASPSPAAGPVRSVQPLPSRPARPRCGAWPSTPPAAPASALRAVLLRERLGRDPEYVTRPPDLAGHAGARRTPPLVIGDPALYFDGDAPRLDLGEEWTGVTGLPFVFAFWAGRPGARHGRGTWRALQEALRARPRRDLPRSRRPTMVTARAARALNEAYLRANIVVRARSRRAGGPARVLPAGARAGADPPRRRS